MAEKRPALGRGLSALIPDAPVARPGGPIEVDVDQLVPNAQQPRHYMDNAALEELAQSIKTHGIIQPILVRQDGPPYRIIAGERRWRAAQRAGLHRVPIVVRELSGGDGQSLELALIENLQRENLDPIDQARAFERLAADFALTPDQIAAAVGKDRSSVANTRRLLKLPEEVQADVSLGALSAGHARALLALPDQAAQRQVAREVIVRGLSVREAEALVRRLAAPKTPAKAGEGAEPAKDVHTRAAEDRLRFALGTKVRIVRRRHGGRIEVDFASEAELNRLYELLTGSR